MGLSAQQFRLLSITGKKADCEFRSMALSQDKVSISRSMATLSDEYQNSMQKTKLVYDYYGSADNATPVSYSVLMTPSALNDHTPITVTDTKGRTILDSRFAQAARSAGIPQEGGSGSASKIMRQNFLNGLFGSGVLNKVRCDEYLKVPYNPNAGMGAGASELILYTDTVDKDGFIEVLKARSATYSSDSFAAGVEVYNGPSSNGRFTMADLLAGENQYTLVMAGTTDKSGSGAKDHVKEVAQKFEETVASMIEAMAVEFANLLDIPDKPKTIEALDHAMNELIDEIFNHENTNDLHWPCIKWPPSLFNDGDRCPITNG